MTVRSKSKRAPGWSIGDLGAAGDVGALAHYADPAYYSLTYRDREQDVAYYVTRALELGGPVLEYGAGNGRVTLPLARQGLSVTGVDLSRPMLRDLKRRLAEEPPEVRRRVTVRHGDVRTARLRRRFRLVIAPFNVVLHLYTLADARAFFTRVREHLAPGGTLLFDFSIPVPADLCLDPQRRFRAPRFRHPVTGRRIRYAERFEYDPIRQLLVVWMEFSPEDGGSPWMVPLTHRQFFPQEMLALLDHAGFRHVRLSQDFSDQPPTAAADSLLVEARVGPSRRRPPSALARRRDNP